MTIGNSKKIYIINGKDYPIETVRQELHDEEFPYNFHFGRLAAQLIEADEVWTFGDVINEKDYVTAIELGKSIWVMG